MRSQSSRSLAAPSALASLAAPSALALLASLAAPTALASLAALASSCSENQEVINAVQFDAGARDDAPADAAEEPAVDSSPPLPPSLGPSLVLDDMHIASTKEDFHAFSLLGMALNGQLTSAIEGGTLLLGLEVRDLDDPSGQNDDMVSVGLYGLGDSDADPADNFNPDNPEQFTTTALFTGNGGDPTIHFAKASVSGGVLHADSVGLLSIPGLPIPFQNPSIDGALAPTADGKYIRTLEGGRLKGVIAASLLSGAPNISMGQCKGSSLLDVLATGCGFFPMQPEVDLDGDGLEKFFDDTGDDGDGGVAKDGVIDRCVDGDGTEILGTGCVSDARIQDGYRLIFVIHGARAIILQP